MAKRRASTKRAARPNLYSTCEPAGGARDLLLVRVPAGLVVGEAFEVVAVVVVRLLTKARAIVLAGLEFLGRVVGHRELLAAGLIRRRINKVERLPENRD